MKKIYSVLLSIVIIVFFSPASSLIADGPEMTLSDKSEAKVYRNQEGIVVDRKNVIYNKAFLLLDDKSSSASLQDYIEKRTEFKKFIPGAVLERSNIKIELYEINGNNLKPVWQFQSDADDILLDTQYFFVEHYGCCASIGYVDMYNYKKQLIVKSDSNPYRISIPNSQNAIFIGFISSRSTGFISKNKNSIGYLFLSTIDGLRETIEFIYNANDYVGASISVLIDHKEDKLIQGQYLSEVELWSKNPWVGPIQNQKYEMRSIDDIDGLKVKVFLSNGDETPAKERLIPILKGSFNGEKKTYYEYNFNQ